MMKRLIFWMLLMPAVLAAQEDQRYQAGAVPMVDGKVVFTKEVSGPSHTQDQLFDKLIAWADSRFQGEKNRVAYRNKEKGEFAVNGTEQLVFTNSAISFDASDMSYHLIVVCQGSAATIRFENITYRYEVSYERKPQRLLAEEVIIDKYALTRGNKLNRINGKFRRETINFVDKVFGEIDLLFAGTQPTATPAVVMQPAQPAPTAPQTPPAQETQRPVKEGYIAFDADKVPQALLMMLPESPIRVAVSEQSATAETDATWKGISKIFGKEVASVTIRETSPVYKQITGSFILSFSKEGTNEPWMIIECEKQGETADGSDKTILGEIKQIWIK